MTKQTKQVCAQRRLRSARASAQSDQSLRCALNGQLRTETFFMRIAKTLIRLGGCPGWSESSLGAHSLCWLCHVAAKFIKHRPIGKSNYVVAFIEPEVRSAVVQLKSKSKEAIMNVFKAKYAVCRIIFLLYLMGQVMRKQVMPYANNKGADQPAHPRNLISAFVVRSLDSIIPLVSRSEISRF